MGCRRGLVGIYTVIIKPFNAELNPIRHLLALLEARHILHVSRIRVNTASGIAFSVSDRPVCTPGSAWPIKRVKTYLK